MVHVPEVQTGRVTDGKQSSTSSHKREQKKQKNCAKLATATVSGIKRRIGCFGTNGSVGTDWVRAMHESQRRNPKLDCGEGDYCGLAKVSVAIFDRNPKFQTKFTLFFLWAFFCILSHFLCAFLMEPQALLGECRGGKIPRAKTETERTQSGGKEGVSRQEI